MGFYRRNNLNFAAIFDFFKGEDLPPSIKVINAMGKLAALVLAVAAIIANVLKGNQTALDVAAISFAVMALCLAVVGASSAGLSNNRTTVGSQLTFTLKRVLFLMFLPAILLTTILFIALWTLHVGPFSPNAAVPLQPAPELHN